MNKQCAYGKQPHIETIPAQQRKKELTHSSATLLWDGVAGTSCSVFRVSRRKSSKSQESKPLVTPLSSPFSELLWLTLLQAVCPEHSHRANFEHD